ncbi:helix-turn-helix transcriptional regulator, partial [Streptomyces sp. NPDC005534]|uniref:helix-turn-helix domain-containing protein n=1 Tax=Streptomyces sp. NPDC005534 TaxID=3155714 RepID=UPI00345648FC
MALRHDVTARQSRLAVELRRLREAAGLTSREAAILLAVNPAQISQIEAGLAGVSEKRLRRLTAQYACTDEAFTDALAAMATERIRGWYLITVERALELGLDTFADLHPNVVAFEERLPN